MRAPLTVLVTGATGFVGGHLCAALLREGHRVRRALRRPDGAGPEDVVVGEIDTGTEWEAALAGVDAVVHLAARVHVMEDRAADPLTEYRRVNTEGTIALARAAARAGVRRFVLVSSIKVNGEATASAPFSVSSVPAPVDPYGRSKWEAEQALHAIGASTGMEAVVLRPPLIYGPGVGANFLRLLRAVDRGVPLPLGRVHNRRSLLYVENLADAIAACLTHSAAGGQTFLVSDGPALSTAELVRRMALALDRPPRLLPVPVRLLKLAGVLTGRSAHVDRLVGSLIVDSEYIRERLGWTPPYSVDDGLARTARWYRELSPQPQEAP